ncbi:MAG TPA: AraC family transcriptional regulator, partial [Polyangiaceae bacterium]|nr:AraC family transcriptional regulator [Polyangiaceae bacterium]
MVARSLEEVPAVVVEASFSGAADGISFQLIQRGHVRVFSRDQVARHPALTAVLRLIADEVDFAKDSSPALLALLFQSLLVYVARIPAALPLPHWFSGARARGQRHPLRDRPVERALELLNADLSKRWTVELLARAVGCSRPAFARRFLRVLGLSPMRYLTCTRLRVAAALLLGSDAGLAEIASRVGYQSEFAFNRAF